MCTMAVSNDVSEGDDRSVVEESVTSQVTASMLNDRISRVRIIQDMFLTGIFRYDTTPRARIRWECFAERT